jgi:hypothetical protein
VEVEVVVEAVLVTLELLEILVTPVTGHVLLLTTYLYQQDLVIRLVFLVEVKSRYHGTHNK